MWIKHQTCSLNSSIRLALPCWRSTQTPLANVSGSIKLCVSAHMYGNVSSSFELHCVNCLFARWCWVMVHAHRFPGALQSGDVEHWQPSVKIRWGRTGSFGLKGSFASSLKAYHMRAEFWHHHFVSHLAVTCRGTRSVTQRPESASVDLNSNMPVSATLKTSTWATARKCILSTHPKIGTKRPLLVLTWQRSYLTLLLPAHCLSEACTQSRWFILLSLDYCSVQDSHQTFLHVSFLIWEWNCAERCWNAHEWNIYKNQHHII